MSNNYPSQNTDTKNKKKVIIAVIVIIAIFVAGLTTGFLLFGQKPESEEEKRKETETSEAKKIKKKSKKMTEGVIITFEANKENPTDYEMDIVEVVFNARLNGAGYYEARVSSENGTITVEIPNVTNADEIEELLSPIAKLTFRDADGNVVLDGATDIKDAEYEYSEIAENAGAAPHVKLTLIQRAVSKFADATRAAAARAGEGKNYISIYLDENPISSPMVSGEINSDTLIITGDFTPESAKMLANQIKSGQLPFELTAISKKIVAK